MSDRGRVSDTPNLDALRERARVLSVMLADPHPGLVSWKLALASVIYDIAAFVGLEPEKGE